MINLGRHRYSEKNITHLHVHPTMFDWVLRVLSALTTLSIWILIAVFYETLAHTNNDFWVFGGASLFVTLLFLLTESKASIRWYNFPFKVNDQNVWRQFFLAKRFMRVVCLELNLIFLLRILASLGGYWDINPRLFDIFSFATLQIIFISMIVYFILAYRWR